MSVVALTLQFIYADKCIYPLTFAGAFGAIIILQNFFRSYGELENNKSEVLRGLTYLGSKTLPIYLIHYYFIPQFSQVFAPIMNVGNPFMWQLSIAFAISAVIIALSLAVEQIICINPYLNWLLLGDKLR